MRLNDHKPRKRFGQNFLKDQHVIQRIVTAIHPKPHERFLEIGPGKGALTNILLQEVPFLEAIEIDRNLAQGLIHQYLPNQLKVYEEDALNFDFNRLYQNKEINKKYRVIGNLPYNISTPLMFHLFQFSHLIEDMHFMLQKEVVDRLSASSNQKDYGRLSIMAQYFCKIEELFTVSPNAFYPKPKVYSAIVRLIPQKPITPTKDIVLLENVVRTAFSQRRKTLTNALRPYLTPSDFKALNIDPILRPEVLAVEDYVRISNYIFENKDL